MNPLGHHDKCQCSRDCKNHYQRQWRAANPDRVRELKQASRLRNLAHTLDLERAAQQRYRDKHPDRKRAAIRRWYEANKERHLATGAEWRARNPDYARSMVAKSSARLRELTRARAHRQGLPWTPKEIEAALNIERPIVEIALELGRTYDAVKDVQRKYASWRTGSRKRDTA